MKAIALHRPGPAGDPGSLVDLDLPVPEPHGRDLRVAVAAVSVNPVDYKVRNGQIPSPELPRVLGWDAVGIVDAVGDSVTRFRPGDRVWYAGALNRPGSNAELQLVDERIVGRAPQSLDDAHAAALPLTALTAWELLFDRLGVPRDGGEGDALLVVGAAGGVGSILVQLARRLTRLRVIGTASRADSRRWVEELGADVVVDHSRPLAAQVRAAVPGGARWIASLTQTDAHFAELVEALAPQGALAVIDDPGPIDVRLLKPKSAALHWELMFTRSLFDTPDLGAQGALLDEIARLVDAGTLRTTLGEHGGRIDAANLRRAHEHLEGGRARGKVVLAGW